VPLRGTTEIALHRKGRGLDRNSCNNGEAIVIDPACADAFHQPFLLIASLRSDGQTGCSREEQNTGTPATAPDRRITQRFCVRASPTAQRSMNRTLRARLTGTPSMDHSP